MNIDESPQEKQKVRFTFRKYERIRKTKEIEFVLTHGKKFFVNGLIIYILERDKEKDKFSRLAVLVSSKVEKKAVVRNKFKRRIREIFRLNKHKIVRPVDIIIIGTKSSVKKKYKELETLFLEVLSKEGLIM